jgi:hypothetical protein
MVKSCSELIELVGWMDGKRIVDRERCGAGKRMGKQGATEGTP